MDWTAIWHDLTHLGVPVSDKALRTVFVYGGLVVLLRVAGKRVLSQLNTFDLVVVLLLSNVVQNAIIGPDNSLLGGLIGAGVPGRHERHLGARRHVRHAADPGPSDGAGQGRRGGPGGDQRVGLRVPEVMAALHRQGADRVEDVEGAMLEPGGAIADGADPDARSASYGELRHAVDELRGHLDDRLAALEAALEASFRGQPRAHSTGCAPCAMSSSLTRLNGREPKKPRSADIGLGCTLSTRGVSPSSGRMLCASRPQSSATSG